MPAGFPLGSPVIMPWADTRPVAGEDSGWGPWMPGIWASWPEAALNGAGLSANVPWQTDRIWYTPGDWQFDANYEPIYHLVTPYTGGSFRVPPGGYLEAQGLVELNNVIKIPALCPSRLLGSDPIATDLVDGGVAVTLGGITARNTHSQRRHWVLDLLLDGPLDRPRLGKLYVDARVAWPYFLRWFEKGITVYLYNTQFGSRSPLCTEYPTPPPTMPYGGPYFGAPTRITGQLVDATSVRWAPGVGDMMLRWQVSITIAEQVPPGRLV